ncbi:hypothetical protein BK004_03255 [bacterium CG10_46_32]|nr:MAG: hypothetical protein BK004_03255 [bacterium CG10_46_32]
MMSKVDKPLTMVERFFARTEQKCQCKTCAGGCCKSDKCRSWMEKYGKAFGRSPGQCKKCMGTGWLLKPRRISLDENGVLSRQVARTTEDGHQIVGGVSTRDTRPPPPRKPRHDTPKEDNEPRPEPNPLGIAGLIATKGGKKSKRRGT